MAVPENLNDGQQEERGSHTQKSGAKLSSGHIVVTSQAVGLRLNYERECQHNTSTYEQESTDHEKGTRPADHAVPWRIAVVGEFLEQRWSAVA